MRLSTFKAEQHVLHVSISAMVSFLAGTFPVVDSVKKIRCMGLIRGKYRHV